MTTQAERALQQEVMLRLRSWPVIVLPVPNGIWVPARTPAERAFVARLIHQMKNAGQLVPGAPDLVVIWNGGAGMLELKRPKSRTLLGIIPQGRPSGSQIEMAERAASLGINHAFCTSWEEVEAKLVEWGVAYMGEDAA